MIQYNKNDWNYSTVIFFIILSYTIILFRNVNTIATMGGLVNKLHLFMSLCVEVNSDLHAP
jgi:hypothetical protein